MVAALVGILCRIVWSDRMNWLSRGAGTANNLMLN